MASSGRDKHVVYEEALRAALQAAPSGTDKLGDVKLWSKQ